FYMRDRAGAPQFIGESAIDHTPMGSTLALATGDAFDVKVQPIVVKRTLMGQGRWRTDMRYKLSNAMAHSVTVSLLQGGLWGDTAVVSESQRSTRRSADVAEWAVQVPANGSNEVTAAFETRF